MGRFSINKWKALIVVAQPLLQGDVNFALGESFIKMLITNNGKITKNKTNDKRSQSIITTSLCKLIELQADSAIFSFDEFLCPPFVPIFKTNNIQNKLKKKLQQHYNSFE